MAVDDEEDEDDEEEDEEDEDEEEVDVSAAVAFQKYVMDAAGLSSVTGKVIAEFDESVGLFLTPRYVVGIDSGCG